MKLIALLATLLLHALVLLPWRLSEPEARKKAMPVGLLGVQEMRFREVGDSGAALACDHVYVGVGFRFDAFRSVIEVAPKSPAWRAGVLVGDVVLNPHQQPDERGYVEYRFTRGERAVAYRMRVEEICEENVPITPAGRIDK